MHVSVNWIQVGTGEATHRTRNDPASGQAGTRSTSGRLLERPPGFDPRLLPDPTSPIAPWVEQLIVTTVNEAIALNLPLLDALEQLTNSLERSGILLTVDDLQWLLGFNPAQFNTSSALAS